ncbi:MAG TPA: hypothetical protein VFY14_14915, partial [Streptomyces sp.]|nr:hypothetical protein [Streptomyces sp.]
PLLLCALLALDRYEERMLSAPGRGRPRHARGGRRLRAVPDPAPHAPSESGRRGPEAGSSGPHGTGRAA